MDLTPQDVRDVQFREKMRGYHQDDVDQFLVQVASTLERLQLRLQEAEARAAGVASKSDELATTEESLKRTLVLAQRTADLAMQEAREEADRLLADARSEHERLVTQSADIKRQLIDESQADIRAELEALEQRRDALIADVTALDAFVTSERTRLSTTLRETLDRLDDGVFEVHEPPDLQAAVDEDPPAAAPSASFGEVSGEQPTPEAPPAAEALAAAQATPEPEADTGPPTEAMAAVNGIQGDQEARSDLDLRDATVTPPSGTPAVVAGPEDAELEDDDPFLAELRRAVTDDEPLGPRADDFSAESSGDDDEEIDFYERDREVSGRVGSRLRRRR